MRAIEYTTGDATAPGLNCNTIIAHICNDIGVFGAGFVVPLAKKYPITKESYLKWARSGQADFKLGEVQFVEITNSLWVANMIGQKMIGFRNGPPIRYEAVEDCLDKVAAFAIKNDAAVVGPRFGSGLAGGRWNIIENIIKRKLCSKDIQVVIYDLGSK